MLLFSQLFISLALLVCVMGAGYELGKSEKMGSIVSLLVAIGYSIVLYVLMHK